jgi:hypothetical protein
MARLSENFSPYASIGNMLVVLAKIRKGWIPNQVDNGEMARIGITASTTSRVLAALQYFELVNEDGKPTDTWKAIATSTTNDYPKVLEGILRNAYPSIFELHPNPADATDIEIANAFIKSEPLNQRDRMVSLFRGLCQEAGLIAGDPLTRERKPAQKQINQKTPPKNGERPEAETPKFKVSSPPEKMPASLVWYNDLGTLMSRLPNPENAHWTKNEKDRWLAALQAMLDLLIKEDEQ